MNGREFVEAFRSAPAVAAVSTASASGGMSAAGGAALRTLGVASHFGIDATPGDGGVVGGLRRLVEAGTRALAPGVEASKLAWSLGAPLPAVAAAGVVAQAAEVAFPGVVARASEVARPLVGRLMSGLNTRYIASAAGVGILASIGLGVAAETVEAVVPGATDRLNAVLSPLAAAIFPGISAWQAAAGLGAGAAVGVGIAAGALALAAPAALSKARETIALWRDARFNASMASAPERTIAERPGPGPWRVLETERGNGRDYVRATVQVGPDGEKDRRIGCDHGFAVWRNGRGAAMVDGHPASAVVFGGDRWMTRMMPRAEAEAMVASGAFGDPAAGAIRLVPDPANAAVPERFHSYFRTLQAARDLGVEGEVLSYDPGAPPGEAPVPIGASLAEVVAPRQISLDSAPAP